MDKLDIKIIFGEYKGYTGRIISGKKKDSKKIFAKFIAQDRDFFIGQLVTVKDKTNTENFVEGDYIQVKDGPLRGFSGIYRLEYNTESGQKMIRLSNLSGYKVMNKNEVEKNGLIIENPTAEDDEKYEVNVYTASQYTKVFLFKKQFETVKESHEKYGSLAKDNVISRNSTTEDVFIQELDPDLEKYETFDDQEDIDNRDQELDTYNYSDDMKNNDVDNDVDNEEEIFNDLINEDEDDVEKYVENLLTETSYKDTQRTVKVKIEDNIFQHLATMVNVARKTLKLENDSNFEFNKFVTDIYPIYKFIKIDNATNPVFYKDEELKKDVKLIAMGSIIKYYNNTVNDYNISTNSLYSVLIYGGMYKYIKKGKLLENLKNDNDVNLEQLGYSVIENTYIDADKPDEIFKNVNENRKRNKYDDFIDAPLFSKKNKFLNLNDVPEVIGTGQMFMNYYEDTEKKAMEMEKEKEILKHVDEINELRTREWKKDYDNSYFSSGQYNYIWVLKDKKNLPPVTLNPSDPESFNFVRENYEKINKIIDISGSKIDHDIKLKGSMKEQFDNLTLNGIPPFEKAKRIADEHGVSELDVSKLIISDNNNIVININTPVKHFIGPFFDFMNSNFNDSLDPLLGISVKSIHIMFVNQLNIKISYQIFLRFMKGLYKDKIEKDILKGIRFSNRFNITNNFSKYNNNLRSELEGNTVPFYKYIVKDELNDAMDFFEASLRIVEDEEERKPKIMIDDIYQEYRKYMIDKARYKSFDKKERYEIYKEVSSRIIDKEIFIALLDDTANILDENQLSLISTYAYTEEYIREERKRDEFLKNFVETAYQNIFGDLMMDETYSKLVPDITDLYTITYLIQIGNNTHMRSLFLLSENNYFEHFLSYGEELMDSGFESKLKILMTDIKKLTSMRNVSELIQRFIDNWNNRSQENISRQFCDEIESWAFSIIENKTKKVKNIFEEKTEKQYYPAGIFSNIMWNKKLKDMILGRVDTFLIQPLQEMKNNKFSIIRFRDYSGEDMDKMDSDQAENKMKEKNKFVNYKKILEKINKRSTSDKTNNKTILNFSQIKRDFAVDQELWDLVMEYMNNYFTNRDVREKDFVIFSNNDKEYFSTQRTGNDMELDKSESFGWIDMINHLTRFYKEYLLDTKITFKKTVKFIDFFVLTVQNKLLYDLKLNREKQKYEFLLDSDKLILYFIALSESLDFSFEKFFRYISSQIHGINYDDFIDFFAHLYKNKDKELPSSNEMMEDFKNYLIDTKKITWRGKNKDSLLYKNYKILFDVIYFICNNSRKGGYEYDNNIEDLMSTLNCLEYKIRQNKKPEFVERLGIPLDHIRKIAKSLNENKQMLKKEFLLNFKLNEDNNTKYILTEEIENKNENKIAIIVMKYMYLQKIYKQYMENPDTIDFNSINTDIVDKEHIFNKERTLNTEGILSVMESLKKEHDSLTNKVFYSFEVSQQTFEKNVKKYYINYVKNTSYGQQYDNDIFSDRWKREYKLYDSGTFSDISEDNIKFLFYLNSCLFKNELIFYNKELDNKYTDAARIIYNLMIKVSPQEVIKSLELAKVDDREFYVYITDIYKSKFKTLYSVNTTKNSNYPYYTEDFKDAVKHAKKIMDSSGHNYMQEYKVKDTDSNDLINAVKVFVKYPFRLKEVLKVKDDVERYFVYDCYSSETPPVLLDSFKTQQESRNYVKMIFSNMGLSYFLSGDDENNKFVTYFTISEVVNKKYQEENTYINRPEDLEILTEEFDIIGYTQGNGEEKGCIIFFCVTDKNKKFLCVPRGTLEERRAMYSKASELFPKASRNKEGFRINTRKITVEFQGYNDSGIPRFPEGLYIS